jgi:hypothetical protein
MKLKALGEMGELRYWKIKEGLIQRLLHRKGTLSSAGSNFPVCTENWAAADRLSVSGASVSNN